MAILAGALALAVTAAPTQARSTYAPGQVVVKYRKGTDGKERSAIWEAAGAKSVSAGSLGSRIRTLRVPRKPKLAAIIKRLRRSPEIVWAVPNYRFHLTDYIPNDPGKGGPTDWQKLQWDFLAESGVNAPKAWDHLIAAGKPGGKGVKVAILDSGIAYRNGGGFRRAPDFARRQFASGHDFGDRDRHPDDEDGHGTAVASVVAARVNNNIFLTGLAYGVKLMPVRVTNFFGEGEANTLARAIRFAARRKADVINMSLEFGMLPYLIRSSDIPQVMAALRFAHRRGVVIVAASGNEAVRWVGLPARAKHVISVGATTENRCLAGYSNTGRGLDVVAPGGGEDDVIPEDSQCNSTKKHKGVYQQAFADMFSYTSFKLRSAEGTSLASPHVAATAALVIASGVLGSSPTPDAVETRLKATAADLGPPGYDSFYGYGLVDAAAATDPNIP